MSVAFEGESVDDTLKPEKRLPGRRRRADVSAAALDEATLRTVLGTIPGAVLVTDAAGRIVIANESGRRLLQAEPDRIAHVLATLSDRSSDPEGVTVSRFEVPDRGRHHLVVFRRPVEALAPRLAQAQAMWGLTPRQTQVLEQLVRGLSNRRVAAELGCSEHTVEQHVTAMLTRVGCGSRTELVAQFWMTF